MDTPTLRLLTFNIHGGVDTRGRPSLAAAADAIAAFAPDLAGLQEVEKGFRARAGFADQPAILAERLGLFWRFVPAIDRAPGTDRGKYGLAVLSAHPFSGDWVERLPGGGEPRILMGTAIRWRGQTINFLHCHLGFDPEARRRQIEAIMAKAAALSGPVVLAGDFNAPPGAAELAPLFTCWCEAQAARGQDLPTFKPRPARIDYIFFPPAWEVVRAEVRSSPASDHDPLTAEVMPIAARFKRV